MPVLNLESEISNGKNAHRVLCQFCNSCILSKQQGNYLRQDVEVNLPTIHAKNTEDPSMIETEALSDFWTVGDMFDFENIGFSNAVDNYKFLTCADCDMGPVGYQEVGSNKVCYVSLVRVKHED